MFTLFAYRIALERSFQSFGAAYVNERSPRVVRLLNAGYFDTTNQWHVRPTTRRLRLERLRTGELAMY